METQGHHRCGSLNLNVRGLGQSATLAINERSNALRREGHRIYKLGLGQSPFPIPSEVVNALRLHAHEDDYLPVAGLPALREAVAEFHRQKDRVQVRPEDVLVGPGSKELLFLLQLTFYGELLVPSPAWVSYIPQARIIGRTVNLIPTTFEENWRVSPQRLESICKADPDRPRILVLNYPGNPEGGSYTAQELEELAAVARRFGVILLSDEIYGQLHHQGAHVSVARFYPEGTIISSGLSKWCGAGGWRLGTFTFPPDLHWLMEAMAAVASETYTSVSTPIQYAAIRAFQDGITIERYLSHVRRILSALVNAARRFCRPPASGCMRRWVLFISFRISHLLPSGWRGVASRVVTLCVKPSCARRVSPSCPDRPFSGHGRNSPPGLPMSASTG